MFGPIFVALLSVTAVGGERSIQVGDVPRFAFQSAPRNGVLVRSLEDLRGAPALFEFWGPRCPGCVRNAVPFALKLQETWGEDLQVVLVEVQGAGDREAARFALRERWFGGRSLWTSESPFWPGGNLLPTGVLLGNEGQVLWKGNPLTQSREIERLVAEQVRARRAPPAGTPESLRPAWSEFLRGNVGRASQLAAEAERNAPSDPAARRAFDAELGALRRKFDARFAQASALAAAGYLDEADARLDDLRSATKADPELNARATGLAATWSAEANRGERDAARQLARLLSRYFESGGDAASTRALLEFAERHAGTKAAARALDWARLAEPAPR